MPAVNRNPITCIDMATKRNHWLAFALDAIKPVDRATTQLMHEKVDLLKKMLGIKYNQENILAEMTLMGGLAQNTHTRYSQKIDFLIIYKGIKKTSLQVLEKRVETIIDFKRFTIKYLKTIFPEAQIEETSNHKIKFANPLWSCTFYLHFGYPQINPNSFSEKYQNSESLMMFNAQFNDFFDINPAKVVDAINTLNENSDNNAKLLIRILKSLNAVSQSPIKLSGYEISCLVYSMDEYCLKKPPGKLLYLLLEMSVYLKNLEDSIFLTLTVKSIDSHPFYFDGNSPYFNEGVKNLKTKLDTLIKHLVLEIDLNTNVFNLPNKAPLT